jgi:hypothetical protein
MVGGDRAPRSSWGDRDDQRGGDRREPRRFSTEGGRQDAYGAGGGGGAGARVPFSEPIRRSAGDDAPVDERAVSTMIRQREEARKSRDYSTADELRNELSRVYDVSVDDDEREWWVGQRKGGTLFGGPRDRRRGGGGSGGGGGRGGGWGGGGRDRRGGGGRGGRGGGGWGGGGGGDRGSMGWD